MAHDKRAELDADFTAFVEANAQRIRSLAEWLSGDPERAADLAQSALERTYVRWPGIRSEDPMAYVRKALLNQQRDWWRRRQHRPEWPAAVVPEVSDLDDHAADHAQREVMRAALAQLTRRERHVVVLRYYADLADSDIAAEVGVAVGTVKSTSARALRKLRALLGPAGAGVPPHLVRPHLVPPDPVPPGPVPPRPAAALAPASPPTAHRPVANFPVANFPTTNVPTRGEA